MTTTELETPETIPALTPPSVELVDRALRDLDYEDRLVGYKMTPSAGNDRANLYSLPQAIVFLLGTRWDSPMLTPGFKGAINWVDLNAFANWLRDAVGDAPLASAVEEHVLPLDSYYAQVQTLSRVLGMRMDQYREVRGVVEQEADEAETTEDAG
ncbi:MAG: hypothetical protein QMC79_07760 [Anaerosomatales bacterium]|nr:hypothetical protein [Anaerosomatales bacterium]